MTGRWDDAHRIYTEFDDTGKMAFQRAYTDTENDELDAHLASGEEAANQSTIKTNLEADLAAMQGILDQSNADLRADPSQEIKQMAKAIRRLTKIALDDYSTPE